MVQLAEEEKFENVIWTDECSVQLETHSLRCYGSSKKVEAQTKTSHKSSFGGGISIRGATPLVIFTGKLCATKLLKIFDAGLFPFVDKSFPSEQPA